MSYLYERYDFSLFESRFRDYSRQDQFSNDGLWALFEYLTQLAEDTGHPIEIDVIGLCCDWVEASAVEICDDYDYDNVSQIQCDTVAVELDNGNYLYQNF